MLSQRRVAAADHGRLVWPITKKKHRGSVPNLWKSLAEISTKPCCVFFVHGGCLMMARFLAYEDFASPWAKPHGSS